MSYPTLDQYNEALQHPNTAFIDSELKNGIVLSNGFGLPIALCGGFALTYSIQCGSKKYAVRCFHKKSDTIESRYKAISSKIKTIQSAYFVNFEFQSIGVSVNKKTAPIVKMAWASGETLAEFIGKNYRSKDKIQTLNTSLCSLADFIESKGFAHGDIALENVMVANDGRSLQLIDYDGMYVDDIKSLGSDNDGNRNFQHPKRDKHAWNAHLDRFSFVELNLALRILELYPQFWAKTQSGPDSILFKANDFADPNNSSLFHELFGMNQFSDDARNFAAICQSSFDKIPTLNDFILRKNIPQVSISILTQGPAITQKYIGAFPVLNATDYNLCSSHVGDRVELIGKIVEVKHGYARNRKPYVFINFGDWHGNIVKIAIWSEGLSVLTDKPDSSWVGKWITVTGLMEPPYQNNRYNYSHLSINITQANQLHILQEKDARYRLSSSGNISKSSSIAVSKVNTSRNNQNILSGMKGNTSTPHKYQLQTNRPVSKNQTILQTIKQQQTSHTNSQQPQRHASAPPSTYKPQQPSSHEKTNNFGWIWWVIIGITVLLFLANK